MDIDIEDSGSPDVLNDSGLGIELCDSAIGDVRQQQPIEALTPLRGDSTGRARSAVVANVQRRERLKQRTRFQSNLDQRRQIGADESAQEAFPARKDKRQTEGLRAGAGARPYSDHIIGQGTFGKGVTDVKRSLDSANDDSICTPKRANHSSSTKCGILTAMMAAAAVRRQEAAEPIPMETLDDDDALQFNPDKHAQSAATYSSGRMLKVKHQKPRLPSDRIPFHFKAAATSEKPFKCWYCGRCVARFRAEQHFRWCVCDKDAVNCYRVLDGTRAQLAGDVGAIPDIVRPQLDNDASSTCIRCQTKTILCHNCYCRAALRGAENILLGRPFQTEHPHPVAFCPSGQTQQMKDFMEIVNEFKAHAKQRSSAIIQRLFVAHSHASVCLDLRHQHALMAKLTKGNLTYQDLAYFVAAVSPSSVTAAQAYLADTELRELTRTIDSIDVLEPLDGLESIALKCAPSLTLFLGSLINQDGRVKSTDDDQFLLSPTLLLHQLVRHRNRKANFGSVSFGIFLWLMGVGEKAWRAIQAYSLVPCRKTIRMQALASIKKIKDDIGLLVTGTIGKLMHVLCVVTDNLDLHRAGHGTHQVMTSLLTTLPGPDHPVCHQMEQHIRDHFAGDPMDLTPRAVLHTTSQHRRWLRGALRQTFEYDLRAACKRASEHLGKLQDTAFQPMVRELLAYFEEQLLYVLPLNDTDEKSYSGIWTHLTLSISALRDVDPSLEHHNLVASPPTFPRETDVKRAALRDKMMRLIHRRDVSDEERAELLLRATSTGAPEIKIVGDFLTVERIFGCLKGAAYNTDKTQFHGIDVVAGHLHISIALVHAVFRIWGAHESSAWSFAAFMHAIRKAALLNSDAAKAHREGKGCVDAYREQLALALLLHWNPRFRDTDVKDRLVLRDDLRTQAQRDRDERAAGDNAEKKAEIAAATNKRIVEDALASVYAKVDGIGAAVLAEFGDTSCNENLTAEQARSRAVAFAQAMKQHHDLSKAELYCSWMLFTMSLHRVNDLATRTGSHQLHSSLFKILPQYFLLIGKTNYFKHCLREATSQSFMGSTASRATHMMARIMRDFNQSGSQAVKLAAADEVIENLHKVCKDGLTKLFQHNAPFESLSDLCQACSLADQLKAMFVRPSSTGNHSSYVQKSASTFGPKILMALTTNQNIPDLPISATCFLRTPQQTESMKGALRQFKTVQVNKDARSGPWF
eukprot:TRINITY_DN12522_c0_g1_i3.p1 TRINITY_DN12522_c0_g1~~TRINITY_DN12522_c0_g1_i3.p1  ORF type:complete len:1201 (+),score=168.58 TRINITY_DN12522_c0_g1_i3:2-3604(+)